MTGGLIALGVAGVILVKRNIIKEEIRRSTTSALAFSIGGSLIVILCGLIYLKAGM